MAFSEPAFPFNYEGDGGQQVTHQGMSLRDWFAGLAMQAAFAGVVARKTNWSEVVAANAYEMADAMLEARK